jgi:catechol 2,3-dioxygenase-like lactoylglutathione lyase family enzyme
MVANTEGDAVPEEEVIPMLSDDAVYPTLPASDLERAKQFYSEKLGLTPDTELPAGVFYRCGGGTRFLVFPSSGAPSGTHTQMGWQVEDIDAMVADLTGKGVVFQEYDTPNLKTINGVASLGPLRAAWFNDSEGNLIGLAQFL